MTTNHERSNTSYTQKREGNQEAKDEQKCNTGCHKREQSEEDDLLTGVRNRRTSDTYQHHPEAKGERSDQEKSYVLEVKKLGKK